MKKSDFYEFYVRNEKSMTTLASLTAELDVEKENLKEDAVVTQKAKEIRDLEQRLASFDSERKTLEVSQYICFLHLQCYAHKYHPLDANKQCTVGKKSMKSTHRILGHSLLRSPVRSHRLLIHLLRTVRYARALR